MQSGAIRKNNNQGWKAYIFWIVFTEVVGILSALFTREGTKIYGVSVIKPLLSPPPLVFPIAWTLLYALMGIGAARIYLAPASKYRIKSLALFLLQLAFNLSWSFIFFNFQLFGLALLWLLALLLIVIWMTVSFKRVDHIAAYMQMPYILWLIFAGYLSLSVWMLNKA